MTPGVFGRSRCQLARMFWAGEHRRVPVCSYRSRATGRLGVPRGGSQRAALARCSIAHPAINVSALLFTRTKCCRCYVKYLLRAFCRCAVRSHSAVPLNLRAYPRWPICAQKETQILYLMPPPPPLRKCANLPRANSTCSCGCVPTVL